MPPKKEPPNKRETTYNQPTKGIKFLPSELENLETMVKDLRLVTGENVTLSRVVRAFTYLKDDKHTIDALAKVISGQI